MQVDKKRVYRVNLCNPLICFGPGGRSRTDTGAPPLGFESDGVTGELTGLASGAGNEIRTRDFNLGKVALYH